MGREVLKERGIQGRQAGRGNERKGTGERGWKVYEGCVASRKGRAREGKERKKNGEKVKKGEMKRRWEGRKVYEGTGAAGNGRRARAIKEGREETRKCKKG